MAPSGIYEAHRNSRHQGRLVCCFWFLSQTVLPEMQQELSEASKILEYLQLDAFSILAASPHPSPFRSIYPTLD